MEFFPRLTLAGKALQFVKSIAAELNMESETSAENILRAYLGDVNNPELVIRQVERQGSVHRILIIGQTGAGKSSLVNLLAAKKVANVSDGAMGCTFKFNTYLAQYGDEVYELIDTVGLNEGANGTVQHKDAMKRLISFIKRNRRGFSCILFVMPKGRITESFEKNHILFYKALLNGEAPSILFLGHCEANDPMDSWIQNEANKRALSSYHFSDIVCGTAQDGGRFGELIKPLRDDTRERLWRSIAQHMLQTPHPIDSGMHVFKRMWNVVCDFFGINWKFVTDQFAAFLDYLKTLGVDDETLQKINTDLH